MSLLVLLAQGFATSALIAVTASALALVFGVVWGASAAVLPRRAETALMRVVEVLAAAPYTLFMITFVVLARSARPALQESWASLVDNRGILVITIAAIEWLALARVVNAHAAALRDRGVVQVARMLGTSRVRVFVRHVVPHAAGPLLASVVLALPSALATESFLSFLGFGVEAPAVSLGTLIASGFRAMSVAPWLFLVPSGTLVATTVALHVAGAWLRDSLRPESGRAV
ncbi:MAG: ABC transporter permease [Deltaproteobacteria bacterium]|nr:ABC transporter permease [Deltaproteobacteria bacterium]